MFALLALTLCEVRDRSCVDLLLVEIRLASKLPKVKERRMLGFVLAVVFVVFLQTYAEDRAIGSRI